MSGAVGSIPSLTRSGRPSGELALELALRQAVDGVAGQPGGRLGGRRDVWGRAELIAGGGVRLPRAHWNPGRQC